MPEDWTGYTSHTRLERLKRIYSKMDLCDECGALPKNPCRQLTYKGHWEMQFNPHKCRKEIGV